MTTSPTIAIVLGTGLGQLASEITDKQEAANKAQPLMTELIKEMVIRAEKNN